MISAQTDTHRHIKKATVQTHTLSLFSGHRGISGIMPLRIELLRFQRGNMSRFWSRVMDLCVWIHTHTRGFITKITSVVGSSSGPRD